MEKKQIFSGQNGDVMVLNSVVSDRKHFNLDRTLRDVGTFGKYQRWKIFWMTILLWMIQIPTNTYVIYAATPNYRCEIPECEDFGSTKYNPAWLPNAVPFVQNTPANCRRYEFIGNYSTKNCFGQESFNPNKIIPCDSFVYDNSFVSILEEFGLTCNEHLWKLTMVGTIRTAASIVFNIPAGFISDMIGRRKTLLACAFANCILSLLKGFLSYNYYWLICFEAMQTAASSGILQTYFILMTEMLGSNQRLFGSVLTFTMLAVGDISLAIIAMYCKTWRSMVIYSSIPGLFVIIYSQTIPESIRWLLVKKRFSEANDIIKNMAETNGVELSKSNYITEDTIEEQNNQEIEKDILSKFFKSPDLILRTVICSFCYIAARFTNFGIVLQSVSVFGFSRFNFALIGIASIIGNIVAQLCTNSWGRRTTIIVSSLLAGISCISFVLIEDVYWIRFSLFFIAKGLMSITFIALYLYSSELFPTSCRQRICSLCSTCGYVGSIAALQVPFLDVLWKPLPFFLYGCMGCLTGVLLFNLPETKSRKMPDTIEELIQQQKTKIHCYNIEAEPLNIQTANEDSKK